MLLLNLLTAKVNIYLCSAALVGRFSPCEVRSVSFRKTQIFKEDFACGVLVLIYC